MTKKAIAPALLMDEFKEELCQRTHAFGILVPATKPQSELAELEPSPSSFDATSLRLCRIIRLGNSAAKIEA